MARKQDIRLSRDKFYIITNGRETEYNYFSLLKQKKSQYDVKIEFHNDSPLELVIYAKKYLTTANQVWVVFDVDDTYKEGQLIPAIQIARKSGVKIAFSNMAFEVWLISHYKQLSKYMTNEELEKELTKYLQENNKKLSYQKSSLDILKKYFVPNYKKAVVNSKIVYQKRQKEQFENLGENSIPCIWEWNSSTNVYKLVEALKLEK